MKNSHLILILMAASVWFLAFALPSANAELEYSTVIHDIADCVIESAEAKEDKGWHAQGGIRIILGAENKPYFVQTMTRQKAMNPSQFIMPAICAPPKLLYAQNKRI